MDGGYLFPFIVLLWGQPSGGPPPLRGPLPVNLPNLSITCSVPRAHPVPVPTDTLAPMMPLGQKMLERYGRTHSDLEKGWVILMKIEGNSVEGPLGAYFPVITSPLESPVSIGVRGIEPPVAKNNILPVWDLWIKALPQFARVPSFDSDLTWLTERVMLAYANQVEKKWRHAWSEKEKTAFHHYGMLYISVLRDLAQLLSSASGGPTQISQPLVLDRPKAEGYTIPSRSSQDSAAHVFASIVREVYIPRFRFFLQYAEHCLWSRKKLDSAFIFPPMNLYRIKLEDYQRQLAHLSPMANGPTPMTKRAKTLETNRIDRSSGGYKTRVKILEGLYAQYKDVNFVKE